VGRFKIPAHIESLKPYPPGKPIKELERELGLTGVIKLASNENPFGPSPLAVAAIKKALADLNRYPDGSGYYLKKRLSRQLGQPAERIVLGCGANEILDLTCRVLVGPGGRAVLPHPSFLVYQKFLQATGAETVLVPLAGLAIDLAAISRAMDEDVRLVIVCNPNNPTGTALRTADIEAFASDLPQGTLLLVDEAYVDFVRDPERGSCLDLVTEERNLIITRTFSKVYGLAGLRVGYGVMPARLADYLNRVRQPFNVTSLALAAAEAALDDEEFLDQTKRRIWAGLDFLVQGLTALGLEVTPSQTNFVLFRTPAPAEAVYERMLAQGVIIRSMAAFGLSDHLRVNVGLEEENKRFLELLPQVLTALGE